MGGLVGQEEGGLGEGEEGRGWVGAGTEVGAAEEAGGRAEVVVEAGEEVEGVEGEAVAEEVGDWEEGGAWAAVAGEGVGVEGGAEVKLPSERPGHTRRIAWTWNPGPCLSDPPEPQQLCL